jgi:hypothetical protein
MLSIDEEVTAFCSRVDNIVVEFGNEKDSDTRSEQCDGLEAMAAKLTLEIEKRCVDPTKREKLQLRVDEAIARAERDFYSICNSDDLREKLNSDEKRRRQCEMGAEFSRCPKYQGLRGDNECEDCGMTRRNKV